MRVIMFAIRLAGLVTLCFAPAAAQNAVALQPQSSFCFTYSTLYLDTTTLTYPAATSTSTPPPPPAIVIGSSSLQPSTTTSAQAVKFSVQPASDNERRDVRKRAIGGWVGDGEDPNPNSCYDAPAFLLNAGQLVEEDSGWPVWATVGDTNLALSDSTGVPPAGAITTTFENIEGVLRWRNESFSNGVAGTCQEESNGQVYFTFAGAGSRPLSCQEVFLVVVTGKQSLCDTLDNDYCST